MVKRRKPVKTRRRKPDPRAQNPDFLACRKKFEAAVNKKYNKGLRGAFMRMFDREAQIQEYSPFLLSPAEGLLALFEMDRMSQRYREPVSDRFYL